MLAVRDANQRLKLDLPDESSYTTIAGFLMDSAGRVLKVGDKVEHGKGAFEIVRMDGRRISRVRFTPNQNNDNRHGKPSQY
jgi:CBS domain containing-hemolysin-like protein